MLVEGRSVDLKADRLAHDYDSGREEQTPEDEQCDCDTLRVHKLSERVLLCPDFASARYRLYEPAVAPV
jgi:hypothetical protein